MPAETLMKIVPVLTSELVPSPTNPRKFFDESYIKDLASSIKEKGILQPLLVRLIKGGKFEIIAGECRWRAAKLAKLESVPVIAKDLDDQQVLETQIIENMQRRDVTPFEEARGYKILHDKFNYSYDDLAVKVGKSKSYIYTRMRLLELSPKVIKALESGEIKLAFAEQFTRIAKHEDQEEILEELVSYHDFEDFGEFKKVLENRYLLRLKDATFDIKDADLVAKCGSCLVCPKRTGAQADLFGEAGKMDSCLDSKCWNGKVEASNKAILDKYKKEGKDVVMLKRGEAFDPERRGLVELKDTDYHLKGNSVSYAAALKTHKALDKVPPVVVVDAKGQVQTFVSKKAVYAALPKKAFEYSPSSNDGARTGFSGAGRKKRLLDLASMRQAWPAAWQLAIDKVTEKPLTGATLRTLTAIIVAHVMRYPDDREIRDRAGAEPKNMLTKSKSDADLRKILWQMCLGGGLADTQLSTQARKVFDLAGVEWGDLKGKAAADITKVKALKDKAKKSSTDFSPAEIADMKKQGWQKKPDGSWTLPSEKTKALAKAAKAGGGGGKR